MDDIEPLIDWLNDREKIAKMELQDFEEETLRLYFEGLTKQADGTLLAIDGTISVIGNMFRFSKIQNGDNQDSQISNRIEQEYARLEIPADSKVHYLLAETSNALLKKLLISFRIPP